MSPNNKMKGLLKGLRYISQIFDDEKEPEMQIGFATDVKHVAHIGWDGPSVNSAPTWMNEFKAPPGFSSAPLANVGEVREEEPDKPDKPRQSRKPSKNSSSSKNTSDNSTKPRKSKVPNQTTDSTSKVLPGLAKKSSRPKRSKDSSVGGSSKRYRTQDLDTGSWVRL